MAATDYLLDLGHPVAYYPGLVKHLGSVNAVLFFSQIFYWHDKAASELGVYKTVEEIEAETGMTYREQATARKQLVERGVLVETNKRLEHRVYYRIDLDRLNEMLESANCGKRISGEPDSAVRGAAKAQVVNKTKTTTETTSKSTADASAKRDVVDEKFDEAWRQYPKREGSNSKQAALREWNARIREGIDPDMLVAAVADDQRACGGARNRPAGNGSSARCIGRSGIRFRSGLPQALRAYQDADSGHCAAHAEVRAYRGDPRERVDFERVDHLVCVDFRPAVLLRLEPLPRDSFERRRCLDSPGPLDLALLFGRVGSGSQQLPCSETGLSCLGQRHFGVDAERRELLFAIESVLHAPVLGAVRHDLEIKPLAVCKTVRLLGRLRATRLQVSERIGLLRHFALGYRRRALQGISPLIPPRCLACTGQSWAMMAAKIPAEQGFAGLFRKSWEALGT